MDAASSESQEQVVAAEILVSGMVQGVCYRAFTQEVAQGLGLSGWVRNLPDGRVQVEVEGTRTRMEQFVERLREGPPRAHVRDVRTTWKSATGKNPQFVIMG
jgi:acylphosphatase